jgi:hypothetical protein
MAIVRENSNFATHVGPQPKVFMPEDQSGKLMFPQMRRAPDYERVKIIVVFLLFALILAGSVMAITVWWGAIDL